MRYGGTKVSTLMAIGPNTISKVQTIEPIHAFCNTGSVFNKCGERRNGAVRAILVRKKLFSGFLAARGGRWRFEQAPGSRGLVMTNIFVARCLCNNVPPEA